MLIAFVDYFTNNMHLMHSPQNVKLPPWGRAPTRFLVYSGHWGFNTTSLMGQQPPNSPLHLSLLFIPNLTFSPLPLFLFFRFSFSHQVNEKERCELP